MLPLLHYYRVEHNIELSCFARIHAGKMHCTSAQTGASERSPLKVSEMSEFEKQLTSPLFGPLLSHCVNSSLDWSLTINSVFVTRQPTNQPTDLLLTQTHTFAASCCRSCQVHDSFHGSLPARERRTNMSNT